jgi:hypothetical protein
MDLASFPSISSLACLSAMTAGAGCLFAAALLTEEILQRMRARCAAVVHCLATS